MEKVLEITGINTRNLNAPVNKETPKEIIKENTEKTTSTKDNPECYNCGEKGNKRPDFSHPKKRINNIEKESE